MSTYELNFGMPYAVTTLLLYVDVVQPEVAARQYVVCVNATAADEDLEIDSLGWNYSLQLEAKFCYLPPQNAPALVRLPPLSLSREISRLRIEPRAWARGAPPVDEAVSSVWAVLPETDGGSTIFQADVTSKRVGNV